MAFRVLGRARSNSSIIFPLLWSHFGAGKQYRYCLPRYADQPSPSPRPFRI